MTHLLDTNICIALIRKRSDSLRERIENYRVGDLGISAITESELRHGAEKSGDPKRNHAAIDRLKLTLPVLEFDATAAYEYGVIRRELERVGEIIGSMDLLIAAHAKSERLVLVTNNLREFRRVKRLTVESWV